MQEDDLECREHFVSPVWVLSQGGCERSETKLCGAHGHRTGKTFTARPLRHSTQRCKFGSQVKPVNAGLLGRCATSIVCSSAGSTSSGSCCRCQARARTPNNSCWPIR